MKLSYYPAPSRWQAQRLPDEMPAFSIDWRVILLIALSHHHDQNVCRSDPAAGPSSDWNHLSDSRRDRTTVA